MDMSVMNLTDQRELLATLHQMDMRNICMDTQSLSMGEIMQRMTEAKEKYKQSKEDLTKSKASTISHSRPNTSANQTRSGTSGRASTTLPPTTSQRPKTSPHTQDFSIARFRPKPPKWEKSLHTDPELEKSLYRIPCFDCTGKNFASLGRETPKGVPTWNPVEVDRNLPPLTSGSCSETFRHQLVKHIDKAVQVVDDEYIRMPTRTERERNMKARAGADLFNLQQTRERILREEAEAEAEAAEAAAVQADRKSPSFSPSHSRSRSKSPSKH